MVKKCKVFLKYELLLLDNNYPVLRSKHTQPYERDTSTCLQLFLNFEPVVMFSVCMAND